MFGWDGYFLVIVPPPFEIPLFFLHVFFPPIFVVRVRKTSNLAVPLILNDVFEAEMRLLGTWSLEQILTLWD